jgi:hypothetical protein
MTSKETNEKVDSYLRPDACYHIPDTEETDLSVHHIYCHKCGEDLGEAMFYIDKNPDYLDGNGIITIREWLEKEGKWEEFILLLFGQLDKERINGEPENIMSKVAYNIAMKQKMNIRFFAIATNPEAFMEHFIAYMEEKQNEY